MVNVLGVARLGVIARFAMEAMRTNEKEDCPEGDDRQGRGLRNGLGRKRYPL